MRWNVLLSAGSRTRLVMVGWLVCALWCCSSRALYGKKLSGVFVGSDGVRPLPDAWVVWIRENRQNQSCHGPDRLDVTALVGVENTTAAPLSLDSDAVVVRIDGKEHTAKAEIFFEGRSYESLPPHSWKWVAFEANNVLPKSELERVSRIELLMRFDGGQKVLRSSFDHIERQPIERLTQIESEVAMQERVAREAERSSITGP